MLATLKLRECMYPQNIQAIEQVPNMRNMNTHQNHFRALLYSEEYLVSSQHIRLSMIDYLCALSYIPSYKTVLGLCVKRTRLLQNMTSQAFLTWSTTVICLCLVHVQQLFNTDDFLWMDTQEVAVTFTREFFWSMFLEASKEKLINILGSRK